jgi:hypothetical protein
LKPESSHGKPAKETKCSDHRHSRCWKNKHSLSDSGK